MPTLQDNCCLLVRVQLKCDGTRWRTAGEVNLNWWMEWVASTLHTTSERGVSSITTANAHTSAASSRLNWRPRRFKWTRPFRRKTKSGFCACHHISIGLYHVNSPNFYYRPLLVQFIISVNTRRRDNECQGRNMLVLSDNVKLNSQVGWTHSSGVLVYLSTEDYALNIYGRIFCIRLGPDKNTYTVGNSIQCIAKCKGNVKFTL